MMRKTRGKLEADFFDIAMADACVLLTVFKQKFDAEIDDADEYPLVKTV